MHLKRLLIAAIVLPLLYVSVTSFSAEYFLALVIFAAAVAQYEFFAMYRISGIMKHAGVLLGIAIIGFIYISRHSLFLNTSMIPDAFAAAFLVIACLRLFSKQDPASSLRDIATVLTAAAYIPGLFIFQIYLREISAGWIIFLYGCVWASDSMAFYAGTSIGGKKLYKQISPNKTVAGLVGSIAGGTAGAVILKYLLNFQGMALTHALLVGAIIGIVAVIGDLVESMFKRDAGVKDSGRIFSEHGGMLDKVDSSLFAGPVLYWAIIIFGFGK